MRVPVALLVLALVMVACNQNKSKSSDPATATSIQARAITPIQAQPVGDSHAGGVVDARGSQGNSPLITISEENKPIKIYSRQEFIDLAVGKTTRQILVILGKPEKTDQIDNQLFWDYHRRTYGEITRNFDSTTTIQFRDGMAIRVMFD